MSSYHPPTRESSEEMLRRAERRVELGADVRGGAYTDSYDKFIRRMYNQATPYHKSNLSSALTGTAEEFERELLPEISASQIVTMDKLMTDSDRHSSHNEPGDYSNEQSKYKPFSPLELLYSEYGTCGIEDKPYQQYQVYQPKQSSEYYSVMNDRPRIEESPALDYKVAKTMSSPNIWGSAEEEKRRYRLAPNNRRFVPPEHKSKHLLIDYSTFPSPRLSPHLYSSAAYVHTEDSRLVGSNFVQLTLRPKDAWTHRVEKLLDDVKAQPRYFY